MENPIKRAEPSHSILPQLTERYSPYVYEPKAVEQEKLLRILEAARWAASSFNEQPWRYILAERTDETAFANALECLVDANQDWAKNAGALLLCCTGKNFSYNKKPNRVNEHDLGLAGANLTIQAVHEGLQVHMMGGIVPSKIRQVYKVPEEFEPLTAIAIGYAAKPDSGHVDQSIADRDTTKRERLPLGEFVFGTTWGESAAQVQS
ncbi:nitroreductase family protein [Rubellicoccus peritrichatus]|uniref:Nitroreductase family protein n=1 Tax=Rubellicoccus peritrichatus TaxID=3080537 RepID=A0AAQ3LAE4_9BACT|nr:nitroreductase family protein [Puniceicoccus sp. CR14]WOO42066.1 nitroreductase family protein [Puniceicoccus sp. CR14]